MKPHPRIDRREHDEIVTGLLKKVRDQEDELNRISLFAAKKYEEAKDRWDRYKALEMEYAHVVSLNEEAAAILTTLQSDLANSDLDQDPDEIYARVGRAVDALR